MNYLMSKMRSYMSTYVGHRMIIPRLDDRYIIAHPRSGRIWTRTILVNIMVPDAGGNPDVFNRVIPGVSIRKAPGLRMLPSPRVMSSHSLYVPGIAPTVYIIRDGRDTLVSSYHYSITRRRYQGNSSVERLDFPTYFDLYMGGYFGPPWHEHIESWLGRGRAAMGDDLLVVRFEDIKQDTFNQIRRIMKHLNITADDATVRQGIQQASIENAREIERERAQRENREIPSGDASFYRGGKTGQWHDSMTPELQERFYSRAGRALELAGYAVETT